MVRILFIDDEPLALDSLRRLIRTQRDGWSAEFVATPGDALALLAKEPFDVVVSDICKPGQEGIAFLSEVARAAPDSVRIVLSGRVSRSSVVDSIGVAHRFLSKPCDPSLLRAAITRACELRRDPRRAEAARIATKLGPLPVLPAIYQKVSEALQRDASLHEIGAILATDPALTLRLLQLANSAYFAPRRPITSAEQATTFLGLEIIRPVILSSGLFSQLAPVGRRRDELELIWKNGLDSATLARRLAESEGMDRVAVAEAFSAAVLHHVGSLLLACASPSERGAERDTTRAVDDVERERFGASHCEIGSHLLLLWGLPDSIAEVAAWHHEPARLLLGGPCSPPFLAAAATTILESKDASTVELARLEEALSRAGARDRLDAWRAQAEDVAEATT